MSSRSLRTKAIASVAGALCVIAFGVHAALARSTPTPSPAPTPTPVADPTVTKLVRQQFVAWQSGSIDKSLYAQKVQQQLNDAKINDVSQKLASLGALTNTVYIGPYVSPDFPPAARGYIYQMQCNEGNVYVFTVLDAEGKIATIYFKDRLVTETVEVPATAAPSPQASP